MKIRDWMATPVEVAKPLDSLLLARSRLEKHRINQLPVVVNNRLVGIISDRDLRDAFPSVLDIDGRRRVQKMLAGPERVNVESVMTRDVLTLGPEDSVEAAAQIMRRERIGAIPILEEGRLVGILTRSDLLDAYVALAAQPATRR